MDHKREILKMAMQSATFTKVKVINACVFVLENKQSRKGEQKWRLK